MNQALEKYKENIKGKKSAVLGFGISNRPLASTLASWGSQVTVFDKKQEAAFTEILPEFREMGVHFSFGEDYLTSLKGFDLIFRTPGMRHDLPQISAAINEGAELTSEMEVFMALCPAFIYAVTGSDGKTTTTTLIYEMLRQDGYRCHLGGNIGNPLLDRVHEIEQSDRVVLELSSFQLQTMQSSPHVAVITNITPNHLDVHKSMEEYINAKKNIFRYQNPSNRIILNYDNAITRSFLAEVKGKPTMFSIKEEGIMGAFVRDGHILYKDSDLEKEILSLKDIILPGMHNVENYLAAIAAVMPEVGIDAIRYVARNFGGVEHRIEFVQKVNGVSFYNDSIGSSPTRTIASIKAFQQKVILIAGGYDKNLSYEELGEVIHSRVKALVLMGDTADKIEAAYRAYAEKSGVALIPVVRAGTMEQAVEKSFEFAHSQDIILLSPASASFDLYNNFMERGNHFKEIVKQVKNPIF